MTGVNNTALGYNALYANTGSNNIAIGAGAGMNFTLGSNNIAIGNAGVAGQSGTIHIGTSSQKKTFITGIYHNSSVSGLAIVINSDGELGTVSSSKRFKTGIEPMGMTTAKLQQLRPVTFQYEADPRGTLRYGLIAEEVAKVYPELVVRDKSGRIDGIRYDELSPMLLNELQKQQQANAAQVAEIRELKGQVAELNDLKQEMRTALSKLQSKEQLVAKR